MKKETAPEGEKFSNFLKCLLAVPHSEIKKRLDAEKRSKKAKKTSSR